MCTMIDTKSTSSTLSSMSSVTNPPSNDPVANPNYYSDHLCQLVRKGGYELGEVVKINSKRSKYNLKYGFVIKLNQTTATVAFVPKSSKDPVTKVNYNYNSQTMVRIPDISGTDRESFRIKNSIQFRKWQAPYLQKCNDVPNSCERISQLEIQNNILKRQLDSQQEDIEDLRREVAALTLIVRREVEIVNYRQNDVPTTNEVHAPIKDGIY